MLKAVGLTPRQVAAVFVIESVALGLLAAVAFVALARLVGVGWCPVPLFAHRLAPWSGLGQDARSKAGQPDPDLDQAGHLHEELTRSNPGPRCRALREGADPDPDRDHTAQDAAQDAGIPGAP